MATIYELKKRAKELAEVSETNAVDPARVGNLIDDTLELIDEYDKNVVGLGIRKTYATVAIMEADEVAPVGDDGKRLRFGQLAVIAAVESVNNGKIYAFRNPGWEYINTIGGLEIAQNIDGGTAFSKYGGSLIINGGNANS